MMPLWKPGEEKSLYQTWWSIKLTHGKWIRFIRVRLPNGQNVYRTFQHEAKRVALAIRTVTLQPSEYGEYAVTFGTEAVADVLTVLNRKGYRCLIIDAPLDVQGMKQ